MLLREPLSATTLRRERPLVADNASVEAVARDFSGDTPGGRGTAKLPEIDIETNIHTRSHLDRLDVAREVKEAFDGDTSLHSDDLFLYLGTAAQMVSNTTREAAQ